MMDTMLGMGQSALMKLLNGGGRGPEPKPSEGAGLPAPGGYDAPVTVEGARTFPNLTPKQAPLMMPNQVGTKNPNPGLNKTAPTWGQG